MSSEKMDYEANSLRKFLSSEESKGIDQLTRMVLKRGIRKQTIRKIFQFESLWMINFK